MFPRDNDRRETLEQYNSLREINRFLETLSSFCISEKALFLDPRNSRLETRYSRLNPRSFRASRLEDRVSRFECQLTFERYCMSCQVIHITRTYMYPSFCSIKQLGQPAQQLFWRCVNRSERRESTKQRVVKRGFFKIKGLQVSILSLTSPPLTSLSFCSRSNLCTATMRKSSSYRNAFYTG